MQSTNGNNDFATKIGGWEVVLIGNMVSFTKPGVKAKIGTTIEFLREQPCDFEQLGEFTEWCVSMLGFRSEHVNALCDWARLCFADEEELAEVQARESAYWAEQESA